LGIAAFLAGLILGILSGLLPGLHSNTIISIISSLGIDEGSLAIMIIALFPAHLVISFIPAIFFGIPEPGTVAAIMPGQRLVLQGRGIVALKIVLASCALAALICIALFSFSLGAFAFAYGVLRSHMGLILLAVSAALLLRSRNAVAATMVFLMSGLLGSYSLSSGMQDPFLPMFSGMFAMAAIINYRKSAVPAQADAECGSGFIGYVLAGVFLGFAADLIPGVGSPAQVAAFASIFIPMGTSGYLACVSAISISEAVFSLATAASIGKSRMGATAWLADNMDIQANLPMLVAGFVASMALAALMVYLARRKIARLASLDFSRMNLVLGIYLLAITFVIDSWTGLAVIVLGSALGWLCVRMEAERISLMGAIIVPTLLFFLT
jgi:putative membrane protein